MPESLPWKSHFHASVKHTSQDVAAQLGLYGLLFFAARLGDQPFGFVDAHAQGFLNGLAQGRQLAWDFAVQSAHDGALALDHLALAFELAKICVEPSHVAQKLVLFGVG